MNSIRVVHLDGNGVERNFDLVRTYLPGVLFHLTAFPVPFKPGRATRSAAITGLTECCAT